MQDPHVVEDLVSVGKAIRAADRGATSGDGPRKNPVQYAMRRRRWDCSEISNQPGEDDDCSCERVPWIWTGRVGEDRHHAPSAGRDTNSKPLNRHNRPNVSRRRRHSSFTLDKQYEVCANADMYAEVKRRAKGPPQIQL